MGAEICVLIVDDDEASLTLLEHGFSEDDYHLLRARDGLEALARLKEVVHCDAIVTDHMMPFMDGMELLRELKGNPRYAGIPVVMQSSLGAPAEVRAAEASGVWAYFIKPYDMGDLVATVAEAVNKARSGVESHAG